MSRRSPLALVLLLTATTRVHAQPAPLPEADVRREEQAFEAARGARYMEQNCADTTFEGWSGFPLKRCTYTIRDRVTGSKTASVILLDAAPRQLARWVVRACMEARHTSGAACTRRLRQQILAESGAQFPVAGIVLEDMDGPGLQKIYVFRDGVTVFVDGITNGSVAPVTPEMSRRAMTAPVVRTGKFARVASTMREQYRANEGTVDVGTSSDRKLSFLGVVRTLYQQARSSDRNELLIAWIRQN